MLTLQDIQPNNRARGKKEGKNLEGRTDWETNDEVHGLYLQVSRPEYHKEYEKTYKGYIVLIPNQV